MAARLLFLLVAFALRASSADTLDGIKGQVSRMNDAWFEACVTASTANGAVNPKGQKLCIDVHRIYSDMFMKFPQK